VRHTIRLAGFWQPDDPAAPTRFTRRFGLPRLTVAGETAWLVIRPASDQFTLNGKSVAATVIDGGCELPLTDCPPRNTLTVSATVEPVAVVEIRGPS
jgi:hypothetical protein